MGDLTIRLGSSFMTMEQPQLPLFLTDEHGATTTTSVAPGDQRTLNLANGSYLVRLQLPSGESIYRQARVDGSTSLDLRPRESRHEWLTREVWSGHDQNLGADLTAERYELGWLRLWCVRERTTSTCPALREPNVASDRDVVKYRIQAEETDCLHYAQLGGPNLPLQILSLPVVGGGWVELVIRADRDAGGFGGGVRMTATSESPAGDVMSQMLHRGAFESLEALSSDLLSHAERALASKTRDPITAAATGYVLLRSHAYDQLHDWPENLARCFGWLPDGAIIYAWQLIEAGSANVRKARAMLLEAVERGIPVFSEGVRLLRDGLVLLNHRSGEGGETQGRLARALERVGTLAEALDWSNPLTSFWGEHPAAPSSVPVNGLPPSVDGLSLLVGVSVATRVRDVQRLAPDNPHAALFLAASAQPDPAAAMRMWLAAIAEAEKLGDGPWVRTMVSALEGLPAVPVAGRPLSEAAARVLSGFLEERQTRLQTFGNLQHEHDLSLHLRSEDSSGSADAARAIYDELVRLAEAHPEEAGVQMLLAAAAAHAATAYGKAGQLDAVRALYDDLLRRAAAYPGDRLLRLERAKAALNAATVFGKARQLDDPLAFLDLMPSPAPSGSYANDSGRWIVETPLGEAEQLEDEAARILVVLMHDALDEPEFRFEWVKAAVNVTTAFGAAGQLDKAARIVDDLLFLAEAYPDERKLRLEWVEAAVNVATAFGEAGQLDKVGRIVDDLKRVSDANPEWAIDIGAVLARIRKPLGHD